MLYDLYILVISMLFMIWSCNNNMPVIKAKYHHSECSKHCICLLHHLIIFQFIAMLNYYCFWSQMPRKASNIGFCSRVLQCINNYIAIHNTIRSNMQDCIFFEFEELQWILTENFLCYWLSVKFYWTMCFQIYKWLQSKFLSFIPKHGKTI